MRAVLLALSSALAIAAGGCNSLLGITDITVGSGSGSDAGSGTCYNAPDDGSLFMGCPKSVPAALTIQGAINTDTDPACVPVGQGTTAPTVCMIAAESITIPSGTYYVSGSLALALVASSKIDVQGTLDASGSTSGTPVAGSVCNLSGSGSYDTTANTGGGGAGGSLGDVSGTGGAGKGSFATGGTSASAIASFTQLRAGCPGAPGGSVADTSPGGAPGGAVYMIAGTSITIEGGGTVLANGAGGGGAMATEGGGGGASGGLVGFDSAVVDIEGTVSAIGGGGGGGGGLDNGGVGMGSTGGNGSTPGGNGGNGGDGFNEAEVGASATGTNGGGGGGGGSIGVIWVHSPSPNLSTATLAPDATVQN